MKKILFAYFICLFFPLYSNEKTELHISLPIQSESSLFYVNRFISDENCLSTSYAKKLEDILTFDLNTNGFSQVLTATAERELSFMAKGMQALHEMRAWHGLSAQIKAKELFVSFYLPLENKVHTFETITLNGDLNTDRKLIHKLADTLFKMIFQKEGICSSKILFAKKEQKQKWISEIWECDYDGGNLRQVTFEESYAISPVYFPPKSGAQSSRFVYISFKKGQPKIYLASLKDGKSKELVSLSGNQLLPCISSQRDLIAFISDTSGRADLFVQKLSEIGSFGKPKQIFSAPRSVQASPSFDPTGRKLAFVSDKDGRPRIYLLHLDENLNKRSDIELLTKQNLENSSPAWSPDGTKLAYSAKTNGVRQIWIYDFSNHTEMQLTEGRDNKENPSWAPDNLHLVYNSTDSLSPELYLIDLRKKTPVKLTQGHYPTWEPRGSKK